MSDKKHWGTFAVVWFDKLSTRLLQENVHITVAPSYHDALRFALCCTWFDEDHFGEIISHKAENKQVPWGNWKELYRLSTMTNHIEDEVIIRVIRLHQNDRLQRSETTVKPFILSYYDSYGEPIVRMCYSDDLKTAVYSFLTVPSPQQTDDTYLTITSMYHLVWRYHRQISVTETPILTGERVYGYIAPLTLPELPSSSSGSDSSLTSPMSTGSLGIREQICRESPDTIDVTDTYKSVEMV